MLSKLLFDPYFLQACYGELVKPKFANGCSINADALLKVSGQGAVYVRLLEKHAVFELDCSSSDSDGESLIQTTMNVCKLKLTLLFILLLWC